MANYSSFPAWRQIYKLSAWEAACLIAGVDPAREDIPDEVGCAPRVYERMIREAIARADYLAWELFDDRMPEEMPTTSDIWGQGESRESYLPSIEMQESVEAVLADPVNAALLLPLDPWYSATIDADSFNRWLEVCEVDSAYTFEAHQGICVVSLEENRSAQEDREQAALTDEQRAAQRAQFRKILERDVAVARPIDTAAPAGDKPSPSLENPLGTRERNTLLSVIGILTSMAGLDLNTAAKTAAVIVNAGAKQGVMLGETTVEGHMKKVAAALAARTK